MSEHWIGLRSIDLELRLPKGSAFRAFKALEMHLHEGRDYRVLHHQHDRELLDALKNEGAIYAGSVNAVILSPACAARLRSDLKNRAGWQ
jgi:hypothetical protein